MCERTAGMAVESGVEKAPGAKVGKRRRKLWDLPRSLHCPVIGTCLPVGELRRLAQKARMQADRPLSDYAVHVSFTSNAETKNPLSVQAQKALERRYASHVRRFASARSAEDLRARWRKAAAGGDVPGALWATVTHPACDEELHTRLFEEIHMLSHQVGAGRIADLRQVERLQDELRTVERDFDALQTRSRRQIEDREQRILELEAHLARTEAERARLAARESLLERELEHARRRAEAPEADRDRRRLQTLEAEHDRWHSAFAQAQAQIAALQEECRERGDECAALERLLADSGEACAGCDEEGCAPGMPDLGGRRVLCVGGRTTLIDHYRSLVTRLNGEFDHHDGGIEDRRRRLESMLSSADAVLCATDCVSHDACHRLKRFCRQHDKPHVFLRSAGLSSFARGLASVAAAGASPPGGDPHEPAAH